MTPYLPLLLAAVTGLAVFGILHGIRLYRADVELPTDLALALEVGSSRTTAVGSVVDRLGIRWAPLVLRLMGPTRVARKRAQIDRAGNPAGLTIDRYAARARSTASSAASAPSPCSSTASWSSPS